jgi:hypothetical protein
MASVHPGLTHFDPPMVDNVAPCPAIALATADATLFACAAGTLRHGHSSDPRTTKPFVNRPSHIENPVMVVS